MTRISLQDFFKDVARIYGDSGSLGGGLIHEKLALVNLTQEDFKILGESLPHELYFDNSGKLVKVTNNKNTYEDVREHPVQIRLGACFRRHIESRALLDRLSFKMITDLVRNEIWGGENANQYECHKEAKDSEPSNANTNCDNFEDTYLISKNLIEEFASKKQREEFTKGYKNFTINFAKEVKQILQEKLSKLTS